MHKFVKTIKNLFLNVRKITGSKILINVRDRMHDLQDAAGPVAKQSSLRIAHLSGITDRRHQKKFADVGKFDDLARNFERQAFGILRLQEITANEVQSFVEVSCRFSALDRILKIEP